MLLCWQSTFITVDLCFILGLRLFPWDKNIFKHNHGCLRTHGLVIRVVAFRERGPGFNLSYFQKSLSPLINGGLGKLKTCRALNGVLMVKIIPNKFIFSWTLGIVESGLQLGLLRKYVSCWYLTKILIVLWLKWEWVWFLLWAVE